MSKLNINEAVLREDGLYDVPIDLTDEEFLILAREAHEQDITLNQLIVNILTEELDKQKPDDTMITYSQEVVDEYRKKAITDVNDLVVGNTYYSNFFGEFVLLGILTHREHCEAVHMAPYGPEDTLDKPAWFLVDNGFGVGHESLNDNNIGASYNPWLIFEDEKTMEEYKASRA